jgi:NAD(P)H-quinone oxidoreductase subunit 5
MWSAPLLYLPLFVPLIFLAAGLASRSLERPLIWRLAAGASLVALLTSLVFLVLTIAFPFAPYGILQASPLTAVMQVLASFIAFVVIRYSCTSMATEARAATYLVWLQLTLAAVTLAVASNHMLMLLAAWTCISLGLHRLLMFFPERPRAALAAHKKFLLARLAELCLLGAFLLLHHVQRSWLISDVLAAYPAQLSWAEQLAALLIAAAALAKCAQLPVHGWLIQVVEAPTPVSALLHGGIINLGGFLLILFGPLLLQAPAAQWLLLAVAGLTMLLAGLIMTTRISAKVRLAWSTSAQMGLMLVECALGLFELALLHLLAHSCYKAHAFLSAGDAVAADVRARQVQVAPPTSAQVVLSLLLASLLVVGVIWALGFFAGHAPSAPWSPWWLLVLALATLLMRGHGVSGLWRWLPTLAVTLTAYVLLKNLLAGLAPHDVYQVSIWADLWLCVLFSLLFAGYHLQTYFAHLPWVNRLNIWLYSGLYLDEWATRATLALWPVRLPVRMHAKQALVIQGEI